MVLRDIDDEKAGTTNRNLIYTSALTEKPLQLARTAQQMAHGAGFIYHCSEGQVGSIVAREFTDVANAGCLLKTFVGIHCNAVADSDWKRWPQAEAGAVVWSPFSNLWLYGSTTNIAAARARGVGVVHQDPILAWNLDAATNVFLGEEPSLRLIGPLAILDDRAMRRASQELLAGFGVTLSCAELARPVRDLSGGQRQAVAIARALRRRPRFLLLDEPTSALAAGPRQGLQRLLRRLVDDGAGVLLASQSLEDALAIADRIIVLRRGRLVAEGPACEMKAEEILRLMEDSGRPWTPEAKRD